MRSWLPRGWLPRLRSERCPKSVILTFGGFLAVALVNTTLRASPDCARAAATNSSNTSRRNASSTAARWA
jgi:hypothetical protein